MPIRESITAGAHKKHAGHKVGHISSPLGGHIVSESISHNKRIQEATNTKEDRHSGNAIYMKQAKHKGGHHLGHHSHHLGTPSVGVEPGHFSGSQTEEHMYGVKEHIISHTTESPSPHALRSQNLMNIVHNTVGTAADLAHSGVLRYTTNHPLKHHDDTEHGTGGIGSIKTQPKTYGQVPFAGREY